VDYWQGLTSEDIVSWNAPNNYKKIGLIVPDTTTEFYNGIMQDVIEICEEAGYECVADGVNGDVTRGITAIETWVASGIDAIIIMAQDQSCDLALKKAMEQGVLVVSASAKVQYYHHWLMQDNYDVGYQTAVMASKWMKDKGYENGQYIVISNNMNEAVTDKSTGVREGMLAELPVGQCVGEVVLATGVVHVRADVDTLLMQNPDVKCIVSMHNAFSMIGLESALAPRFCALELRDHTRMPRDLWARSGEDSLTGLFLRTMAARCADAPEDEALALAVRFGLAALENGEDVSP
jgi:ABC-type sugar transport system substrate-binding protein